MKKILIVACLVATLSAKSQTGSKVDSTAIINKFVDSLVTHTTVKQWQDYLFDRVSINYFNKATFTELWNLYLNDQLSIWIQRQKSKK